MMDEKKKCLSELNDAILVAQKQMHKLEAAIEIIEGVKKALEETEDDDDT